MTNAFVHIFPCQDDEEEWKTEAARMADVYGGCVFTISALCSANTTEGFLRNRAFGRFAVGDITISYGTWQDSLKLLVRKEPRSLRKEFEYSPLNERAWPLQERILAPAVLHWGRDQLLWECNTSHLCSETGETDDWGGIVIRLSDIVGAPFRLGPRDLWDCIVDEYTRRQLSKAEDRLSAVSGLASRLREDGTHKGRYVAGLWESDLDFHLLWRLVVESGIDYGESVQPNLHIPTWSWAHINHQVLEVEHSRLVT
jgi:hypothetical protein